MRLMQRLGLGLGSGGGGGGGKKLDAMDHVVG